MINHVTPSEIITALSILMESIDSYKFVSRKELEKQAATLPLKDFVNNNTSHQNDEGEPTDVKTYHTILHPSHIDPFEADDWDDWKNETLKNSKAHGHVMTLKNKLLNGEQVRPILIEGTDFDTKYRPMVHDGHHRVYASLLANKPIRAQYDERTLSKLWANTRNLNLTSMELYRMYKK